MGGNWVVNFQYLFHEMVAKYSSNKNANSIGFVPIMLCVIQYVMLNLYIYVCVMWCMSLGKMFLFVKKVF